MGSRGKRERQSNASDEVLRSEVQVMLERVLSRMSKKVEEIDSGRVLILLLCGSFLEACGQCAAVGDVRRFLI